MSESILTSTKKRLGLTEDNEQFDEDVIMDINTVLNILTQMGVGPQEGFFIVDKNSKWDDFLQNDSQILQMVKTYVFIRVKLLFDSTTTPQSVIEVMIRQYQALEWRIHDYINYQKAATSNACSYEHTSGL